MTQDNSDGTHAVQQRVLEQLILLSDQQEHALMQGNVAVLEELTEQRRRLVHEAAASLPPHQPWTPEMLFLAARAKERLDALQVLMTERMAAIRQELAALTESRQLKEYLSPAAPRRGGRWQA